MASIDRYRPPPREGYQPPVIPANSSSGNISSSRPDRPSKSPLRKRDVPPPVPSPPTHSSRTSPPRPHSRRSAAASPSRSAAAAPTKPSAMVENQWYFTEDEVLSSPSIVDGLPPAEERLRRAKGVNFICQAGILLELPQITLYVAGVFFHRFYMRCSMVEEKRGVHHYNMAATALFLANKTEENCRKTKDIIIAVAKVAQKNPRLIVDEQAKEYWRWRDSILMYEEVMLENLTFDLMVDNPHSKLYEFLGKLGVIHNKSLRNAAWTFCNDACMTPLPLLMEAHDIAVASIFFSSTYTRQELEDVDGQAWWKSLRGNEEKCVKAIRVMKEFYTENPLRKTEDRYQRSPGDFLLENTRRRGEEAGSSDNATPRTDRATQSPKGRVNGMDEAAAEREIDTAAAESASQMAPGDSDAALKEAANNPTIHPDTNGDALLSPNKRKDIESSSETREQKRQRLSSDDHDEGEVPE
ncbi:cyclin-like protein [Xylariaceae sp. FL0804]|nr:cyclin-like protein [Xylariaceae sp. FL0804]